VQILADDFPRAENLTFENTSGNHGQALALRADGDRAVFKNCRIVGWQDTLMINNGRQYFADCYIAGRVDFHLRIGDGGFRALRNPQPQRRHITAASTPQDHPFVCLHELQANRRRNPMDNRNNQSNVATRRR
jgi:pectinesterase